MEGPVSIDLWTLLFQSGNVLIVLLVLWYFLFKPLGQMMEERTKFVEDSLANAERQREEAQKLLEQYQEQLRHAQAEAREIVANATREAEELARQRREATEAEIKRMLERAKAEIEAERLRALESIRDEVATLTLMVAERVIARELNEVDHRRLVEQMLAEVTSGAVKAGDDR